MRNIVKAGSAISLLFSSSITGAATSTAAGCTGTVSKVWVETNDYLYYEIEPSSSTSCTCNFNIGNAKGFIVPSSQPNKDEQYTALLAAFMADKKVMVWYDWDGVDGSNRCKGYNISLSK
ncbi:hypothetical protein ACJJIC_17415 [Microbulbifer sp. ANSA002]|uniref:hypothetical protein n=1 Tax=unclassified Microbulbifer TaxID=2619833 RepID=UPI0040421531